MDLNFDPDELAFRDEVRRFLAAHLPEDIRERVRRGDDSCVARDIPRWQRILHERAWGAPAWPVEFGGTGWDKTHQYIFETECALADAPVQLAFAVKMVAPVLMRYGSAAQQQRFLPRILDGSEWWCQGYSEPGAGSDLASLKTRAQRDGAHYVVNGQKAWNTLGQFADWIFCLVRTAPGGKPQQGISFLLIDMKTSGITVRPTRLLDGSCEVNEIWFDNVRVPAGNLVGEENQGWTYAKFLLGHERTNIAGVGASKRELIRLKGAARELRRAGQPLIDDPVFAAKIAQVEIELMALEITNLRVIFAEARQQAPGPEASMLKIRGTEIMQRISELQVEALGPQALEVRALEARSLEACSSSAGDGGDPSSVAYSPAAEIAARATAAYLNLRKVSIYGGSNEIQRNIIAQMILRV